MICSHEGINHFAHSEFKKNDFPQELGPNQSWEHEICSGSGVDNRFKIKHFDNTGETRIFEQNLIPVTE
jgi:hypothetical protein